MSRFVLSTGLAALITLAGCGEPADKAAAPDLAAKAAKLARATIIVDTHIDVPYRLNHAWEDVTGATATGDFDYPRAVAGGLNAPFMSIFTPADLGNGAEATAHAHAMIDLVEKTVALAPEKYEIAASVSQVEAAFAAGRIALPLGMENGSPIAGDLANLQTFFDRGIRYITLTHGKSNHISDSSYDENHAWDGLSPFGETVVAEMNRLGIMVDISHVSDDAFWDVMALTDVPAIASHSSARHFTPGFERNMDDAMIARLADEGGVIMINYGSAFLTATANEWNVAKKAAFEAWLVAQDLTKTDERDDAFNLTYRETHSYPYADLDDVLDHVDHVVALAGIDHVGIGSDYDGVGDSLPTGLKDVASYPTLIEGLLKRGYTAPDIAKILSGNLLRVWRAVEAAAEG